MSTSILRTMVAAVALAVALAQAAPRAQAPLDLKHTRWPARWITAPGADPFGYGVYHFRKRFTLAAKPGRFVVHVTGDNRYQLFVNGTRVVWGPARGDLNHWRYETIDLAPHLRAGENLLAAVVWNFGELAPEAQTTWRTGFLLQGDGAAEQAVNTNESWRTVPDPAYRPIVFTHAQMRGYYVVGPGDRVDGRSYPWGWELPSFDDAAWPAAVPAVGDGRAGGSPRDSRDSPNRWLLVPRSIPLMEERPERLASTRQADGVTVPASFPRAPGPITIPARTSARLLLDQGYLTTAYPVLTFSGGAGASISMGYAEALYTKGPGRPEKGNRNDVAGKEFVGNHDTIVADGGAGRRFTPLWWRTYRYLQVTVDTQDAPLTIVDVHGIYTGYPFERRARFDGGSARLTEVLDVGWRTARLCAHESFMDCPYYEQLQYAGDTRIQALVSLFTTGDPRLVRNAIAQINDSRTAEGATMSRAPTRQQQYIPPFSLWWIGMVHDYARYVDDAAFVREMLPGVRAVLDYYAGFQDASGRLGPMPWWNFVDWAREWNGGVPPRGRDGGSALLDLQLLLAYDWAADLETAVGSGARAAEDRAAARMLRETSFARYWDGDRGLLADTIDRESYSQHANALAVLAGVVPAADAPGVVDRLFSDSTLTQASYYFRHYLHAALHQVGGGDRYLDMLGEWDGMLARGLTTWAERPDRPADPSRSDCHAWSASPNYELLRTVLGVDSAAMGFARVRVAPNPGALTRVSGSVPHPRGAIDVSYSVTGHAITAEVRLPDGVNGVFEWRGERRLLEPGTSRFTLEGRRQ